MSKTDMVRAYTESLLKQILEADLGRRQLALRSRWGLPSAVQERSLLRAHR